MFWMSLLPGLKEVELLADEVLHSKRSYGKKRLCCFFPTLFSPLGSKIKHVII